MNKKKQKPIFQRRIFWDVDFDKMNYDKYPRFVIERVFERGDVDDIRQCRRYYGDEKIRDVLTTAKWMSKQSVYLAAAILDNNLSDYKCYRLAQSNPQLWLW
ncbi:MAG: hypothetical protein LBE82_03145 [Chitinophagaceae bacterium]|jgi:hypothetical protein|nr:hypothetical protein [Chitinophagaceae bacterium]